MMRKCGYQCKSGQQTNRGAQQKQQNAKRVYQKHYLKHWGHDIPLYPHLRIISDRFFIKQNRLNLGKYLIVQHSGSI